MFESMIKSYFGLNCKVEKADIKGLPLYMTSGREFLMANIEGFIFLLVKVSSNDRFGASALEKQRISLKQITSCEVAFAFDGLTKLQREALIAKGIPFIAVFDQIYLPFLGIAMRNNLKSGTKVVTDKMMPATQCLFLYLLYNHQNEYILKKQAANALELTKTSITRASEQLKAMGLITEKISGREIRMKTVSTGYELYKLAKAFLISPVQRRIYVEKNTFCESLLSGGESALSKGSMLGEPKYSVRAVYKGDTLIKELTEIEIKWQENVDAVQIELWKYNPALFGKSGAVDPVSLALSLSDNNDERVQGELDRYMEEYEW